MKLSKILVSLFLGGGALVCLSLGAFAEESVTDVGTTAAVQFLNDAPKETPPIPPHKLPPGSIESENCEGGGASHKDHASDDDSETSSHNKWADFNGGIGKESNDDSPSIGSGKLPQTGENKNYWLIILGAVVIVATGILYKKKQLSNEHKRRAS